MAYDIQQSTTQSALLFLLVQSSDHITGLTGASPTVTISKNGAAFASPSGAVTEIGSGWYKVAGNATDTNTLGPLALHATAASGDPSDVVVANIVAYNPQDSVRIGLTALPNATAGASGGLLISGSNAGTTTFGALTCTGTMTISDGVVISRSSSNVSGMTITGNGTGHGLVATSGSGATGDGVQFTSAATNGNGLKTTGAGTGAGELVTGGATGNGMKIIGGATSGDALITSATSGHGATFAGTGTTKHGINATGGATSSDGIRATGGGTGNGINAISGSGATGDGIVATAASTNGNGMTLTHAGSGQDFNATTTPLIAASVAGAVGSVTGNVGGNVTGTVASVVGAVGSVTGNVGGNVTGSVASVVAAVAITSNAKKNTQLTAYMFLMTDSTTHQPKTGLTVSATRSLDGAAYSACANSVTEVANGMYKITLAATDMNANVVALRFTATAADDLDQVILTQP